jgi:predicted regulator of Ras-like GTPase activity (Roadblock/LC7/MglB family)
VRLVLCAVRWLPTVLQSSIEETLQRIKSTEGVQGFVIVDQNGGILRKSDSFSDEQSTQYGALIDDLTRMGMGAVRDLDPRVSVRGAPICRRGG